MSRCSKESSVCLCQPVFEGQLHCGHKSEVPGHPKGPQGPETQLHLPWGRKGCFRRFLRRFSSGRNPRLIGDNGAGKTTLVKLIAGALPLQAGQLIWGEEELKKSRADRLNLGISWIPQAPELALDFKVWEHIILGQEEGHPLSLDSRASIRRIKGIQDRYEIPLPLGCQVRMLNAGQLQLMSLISALLSEPEILLLDEPTASLNQGETGHLHKILQNLKGQGKIILLISHKLPEVQLLADKVSLLQGGRLLASFSSGEKGMAELRQLYSETRMRENQGFRDPNKSTVFAVEGLGYENRRAQVPQRLGFFWSKKGKSWPS
jgi:ABC-type uncharacterized transport system ATPase subunit